MGPREGGKKVIERSVVGQIDNASLQAPFVPVPMEQVVMSNRQIEKTARRDPRWIVVVILGPRRWNAYPRGPKL
jgi:hypothetical protein